MSNLRSGFGCFVLGLLTVLVSSLSLLAQGPPGVNQRGAENFRLTARATPVFPHQKVAEQFANSYDAGDSYSTPAGPRRLLRLTGALAIRLKDGVEERGTLARLTGPNGPLDGFSVGFRHANGLLLLDSTPAERDRQLRTPSLRDGRLAAARTAAEVGAANPVFVEPQTGLRMVPSSEIIVRLKPDTDPRNYFGRDWANVRRLKGTTDQYVLALSTGRAEEVFAQLNRHAAEPRVQWAEPNFLAQGILHAIPNDPIFDGQWHLQNTGQNLGVTGADIKALQAWDTTTGNSDVIIAVLDTGTQTAHPDLQANLAINAGEIQGNGLDDDNNGYIDDINGWDFYAGYSPGSSDPSPKVAADMHGTATAGVAVAVGNNGIGVTGSAYSARLLPLRLGEEQGDGTFNAFTAGIVEAVYYAGGRTADGQGTWRGADILSLSISTSQSSAMDDALHWTATQGRARKGCPIFVSSGNGASGWRAITYTGFTPGTSYTFRWEYQKDGSFSSGDDAVWLDDVFFPDNSFEGFEGSTFPPTGWTTGGSASWTMYAQSDRVLGTGAKSARSGVIGDSQTTYLQAPARLAASANLSFSYWVSSRSGDNFRFLVDGVLQSGYTPSGVPSVETTVSYPASHVDTIAVGASTDFDFRSDYSQFGSDLEIVAPSSGGNAGIYTTDRTGVDGYNNSSGSAGDYIADFGGTSASCPLAAGVAALVLSANPGLTASDVRAILHNTADKIGGVTYTAGFNQYYGYGRVNAQQAVAAALADLSVAISGSPDPVNPGSNLDYTIAVLNNGPASAHEVIVTTTMPRGVAFGSASGGYTLNGTTLAHDLGTLASGGTVQIIVTVIPLSPGSIQCTTSIASSSLDSNSANNSAAAETRVNSPPSISDIADQNTPQSIPTPPIPFTVSDLESPAGNLFVSASSSNTALVPNSNVFFGGSMENRTIQLAPEPGQSGVTTITVTVSDPDGGSNSDSFILTVGTAVKGRYIFYNQSGFDGNDAAANVSDDGAIATDKTALLPGGTATFANYTSYSRGINGIMVDIAGLPGTPTSSDFEFRVGNDHSPAGWSVSPAPTSITVRPGDGIGGSSRLTLIWANGAIKKQWLQVTVKATAITGLGANDVFYFGNAVGEVGNSTGNAVVNALDASQVRVNTRNSDNPAPIDFRFDINRDAVVNALDASVIRVNTTSSDTALQLITIAP